MSEALAKAMLRTQIGKVQALRPYGECTPEELTQHKEVLYRLFEPQFQRNLGLLSEEGRGEFCTSVTECLSNLEQLQVSPALACMCASLQYGKDSPQLIQAADAWVQKITIVMGVDGMDPALILEIVTSAPFAQYHVSMTDRAKEGLVSAISKNVSSFDATMQKDLVSSITPVNDEIVNVLETSTLEILHWMDHAPIPPENGAKLLGIFKNLLSNPILKLFTTLKDAMTKERFMVSLALVLTSIEEPTRFLWMTTVETDLPKYSKELQDKFFTTKQHGNVMANWMASMVGQYNDSLVNLTNTLFKDSPAKKQEFRGILIRTITEAADSDGWCGLDRVPEPVTASILKYYAQTHDGFFCPGFAVKKATLGQVLSTFGSTFEYDDSQGRCRIVPGMAGTQGGAASGTGQRANGTTDANLVDLLLTEAVGRAATPVGDTVEAMRLGNAAYKINNKEVTFVVENGTLFVQSIDATQVRLGVDQFLASEMNAIAAQRGQTQAPAGSGNKPSDMLMGGLVKKGINWEDSKLLAKIVRKGVKANDTAWLQKWEKFCMDHGSVFEDARKAPPSLVKQFITNNLTDLMTKPWGKKYVYHGADSGSEDEGKKGKSDELSFEAFQKREQERLAAAKMAEKETPVVYDRPEDDPFYKTAFCRFAQKGTCWFGDTCYYAHTDQELRKPPEGFEGPADQVGMTMNKGKPGEMRAAPLVPKLKMAGVPGGGFAEFMKNNPSGIEKEKKEKKSKKRKHGDEKKSRKERKVNIDDDDL